MQDKKPPCEDEDAQLWEAVKETVTPLNKEKTTIPLPKKPKTVEIIQPAQEVVVKAVHKPVISSICGAGKGIERSLSKTMRAGNFKIDYQSDLHGKTLEQANRFVHSVVKLSWSDQNRNLLFVTGKSGSIKREFTEWVKQKPTSQMIFYCCPAHKKHGGDGAFYIVLRRRK